MLVRKKKLGKTVVEDITQDLKAYLTEVTGLTIRIEPSDGKRRLPPFLVRQYGLYSLEVGSRKYTGLLVRDPEGFRPSVLAKHLDRLFAEQKADYCFIASALPSYVRRRLLERHIPFVVPWSQMYLPAFGMEHRQRTRRSVRHYSGQLSPATQVVVLSALLGKLPEPITPSELAERLHYTAMTMTRVLGELEVSGMATVKKQGRMRLLAFLQSPKELWEQARLKMRNPVVRTFSISELNLSPEQSLLAGESALAIYSQLAHPSVPVYAVSREQSRNILHDINEQMPRGEEGSCVLQVWRYDPLLLGRDGCVDPFSLFLSLHDAEDERIQIALDQMMEDRI